MAVTYIAHPHDAVRLGDALNTNLANADWESFRAAVAFVKRSGVRHLAAGIADFCRRGSVRISIGIDRGGTSLDGVVALRSAVGATGEVWVFHNENNSTFHPKLFLFRNQRRAQVFVGSGNLTEGGLFTNYEAIVGLSLDLAVEPERLLLATIEASLDRWTSPEGSTAVQLTDGVVARLAAEGYLPPEVFVRDGREEGEGEAAPLDGAPATQAEPALFAAVAVPRPARPPQPERRVPAERGIAVGEAPPPAEVPADVAARKVFYMTLQQTDVGRGQTTAGTSARSPEIFIPLAARDADPDFWGWPGRFTEDAGKPGKWDRSAVQALLGTALVSINMMTWPDKHDFRLRSEDLRSAANVGDVLRIERAADGSRYDYMVSIIPQGSIQYAAARARCTTRVRPPSVKEWGYV